MPPLRIALDGPAGAGKSTLAALLAKRFSLIHVNTGALYRAVGLAAKRAGLSPEDASREECVAPLLPNLRITLRFGEDGQATILCGEDVSPLLYTPEIADYASRVSALPCVRAFLLETQREIARTTPVILDGRDIGSVILPDADVKIFLTASDEARARRRAAELREKGQEARYEDILREQKERDARDRARETAPLIAPPDALLLDNSDLTLEQTFKAAVALVEKKIGGGA